MSWIIISPYNLPKRFVARDPILYILKFTGFLLLFPKHD